MDNHQMPSGYRNNNPCNLCKGHQWEGLDTPPDDGTFCRFKNMDMGFRAALELLDSYYHQQRLHCVKQLIMRWAPPDAPIKHYIRFVSASAMVQPSQYLTDPSLCPEPWTSIVVAMANLMNGVGWHDQKVLNQSAREAWYMLYDS